MTPFRLLCYSCSLGAGIVIVALCATVAAFLSTGLWERLNEIRVFLSAFLGAGKR